MSNNKKQVDINLLDLFSGIGGFSQGLKQAGFNINKHYHAEIDKHANAIYKKQFPNAELLGDVRHVHSADLERIDVITFGSPCQDFSIAGKRQGLDGDRSSLISEAIRLIDECRPDFFIWENVKGAFSSNAGEDFWAIIQAFTNIGGYRLEWQLLNTSWLLPQNRERIYLVGRIAERCCREIFPIAENDKPLCYQKKRLHREVQADKDISACLTSRMHKMGIIDNYIQVGKLRLHYKDDNGFRPMKDNIAPTITAMSRPTGDGMATIKTRQKPRGNNKGSDFDICPTISSSSFEHNNHVVNERIRKLTEIECERLQGFKDDWTKYGNYGGEIKQVSATQRYKCIGNAVTVDVVQMVAERILNNTDLGVAV